MLHRSCTTIATRGVLAHDTVASATVIAVAGEE
jgi:hypothetical protein